MIDYWRSYKILPAEVCVPHWGSFWDALGNFMARLRSFGNSGSCLGNWNSKNLLFWRGCGPIGLEHGLLTITILRINDARLSWKPMLKANRPTSSSEQQILRIPISQTRARVSETPKPSHKISQSVPKRPSMGNTHLCWQYFIAPSIIDYSSANSLL